MQACWIKPEPANPSMEFSIQNFSSYNLELTIFNAGIPSQSPKDTTVFLPTNNGISYFYYSISESLVEPADSAFIIFSNERQIIYRKYDDQPRNLLGINNWESISNPNFLFQYIYNITDEDYENAEEIEK